MSVPLPGRELGWPPQNYVLSLIWFCKGLQYHLEGQAAYHRSAVIQTRQKFKDLHYCESTLRNVLGTQKTTAPRDGEGSGGATPVTKKINILFGKTGRAF